MSGAEMRSKEILFLTSKQAGTYAVLPILQAAIVADVQVECYMRDKRSWGAYILIEVDGGRLWDTTFVGEYLRKCPNVVWGPEEGARREFLERQVCELARERGIWIWDYKLVVMNPTPKTLRSIIANLGRSIEVPGCRWTAEDVEAATRILKAKIVETGNVQK
jgi:hypothetical protein